jgi:hypothetical protein
MFMKLTAEFVATNTRKKENCVHPDEYTFNLHKASRKDVYIGTEMLHVTWIV